MPRERRTWQLIDPSWKGRNWASRTATVAVLILTFLCKGMRGQQTEGYTLKAPASVSVQRGLCVHIPCTFTYDSQLRTSSQKLNAYWLQDKASWNYYGNTPRYLVATNDKYKKVHYSFSSRFQLTGNPEHGDCSFSINDVKSDDQELYYLRIDDGQSLKFSYRNSYTRPRVVVNELMEKPKIWKSSEIILGTPVTITCQAPGTCSGTPPKISWTPDYIGYTYIGNGESWKQPHSNGSMTYGSNITFTPSRDSKGQVLTCRVTYPAAEWRTVENTIRLDTAYAPSSVQITVNITSDGHPGSSQQRSKDGQVEVMEGKSVSLLCQSNSIPDPLLIWTKVNKTLNDSKQAKEHHLLLPKIRPEDSGLYQCQAKNLLGSVEETLRVIVKYVPILIGEPNSTCWPEDNGFFCTCTLHAFPTPHIQWEVDGETLRGNSSRGTLSMTSWHDGKWATSNLKLTGNLNGNHSIICLGFNSLGGSRMQFLLSSFRAELHNGILTGLFGSETKGIIFLLSLCLIKVFLCFLVFYTFRFFNARKIPPRKGPMTTSGL